ncbi:MAG TPA: hypothetical protein VGU64_06080 [Terriglobales bacterium]|nr:hypothetical protein [Terriglobales bacterium]
MKKSDHITAPRLWMVITRSHRALTLLAEQSIAKAGLCLTDFAVLEALLHKGPLTISQIQDKVLLASGSMTANSRCLGRSVRQLPGSVGNARS